MCEITSQKKNESLIHNKPQ